MADSPSSSSAQPTCSFCGIEKSPQIPLIAGNYGHICEQCVKLAYQVVSSWGRRTNNPSEPELKTPLAIKDFLDEYIIGQDEAKKTLSVAVYNHYLRLKFQDGQSESRIPLNGGNDMVELEKSNILLAGPSGTGKTLLVKTLARIIGVPFVIGDATTLTQAGYVGEDVDSLLKRLLEAAEGDVQQAQWGIVYIDEIDKIARRGGGGASARDVSGEGVQQALLKMVEGSEVRISKSGRREGGEEVVLNTQNILFIVGGAFPGLAELISKRLQPPKSGVGFSAPINTATAISNEQLLAALQPDDLLQFGLIPEFIGRFPVITFLQDLDVDSLKRILTEPRNALTKQYRQLFAFQNVGLEFTDDSLTFIAKEAVKRGTGARGLRGMMESMLLSTMFDLPSRANLKSCTVQISGEEEAAQLSVREEFGDGEVLQEPLPTPVVPAEAEELAEPSASRSGQALS
tara:strand:- start:429 stop:1802 length:1374 start_codon:yes stop_codon:yes gene_type:complete